MVMQFLHRQCPSPSTPAFFFSPALWSPERHINFPLWFKTVVKTVFLSWNRNYWLHQQFQEYVHLLHGEQNLFDSPASSASFARSQAGPQVDTSSNCVTSPKGPTRKKPRLVSVVEVSRIPCLPQPSQQQQPPVFHPIGVLPNRILVRKSYTHTTVMSSQAAKQLPVKRSRTGGNPATTTVRGLDVVVPPAVLDIIATMLCWPPANPPLPPTPRLHFTWVAGAEAGEDDDDDDVKVLKVVPGKPPGCGTMETEATTNRLIKNMVRFSMCSRTCLAACERISVLLSIQSSVRRTGLRCIRGAEIDADSSSGAGDAGWVKLAEGNVGVLDRHLAELKAATKMLESAVKQCEWEKNVVTAKKLTIHYEEALKRRWKLGIDDPSWEQRMMRYYELRSRAMRICISESESEKDDTDSDDEYYGIKAVSTTNRYSGAIWFLCHCHNKKRVFIYCFGHMVKRGRDCDEIDQLQEFEIEVFYCCVESTAPPPPFPLNRHSWSCLGVLSTEGSASTDDWSIDTSVMSKICKLAGFGTEVEEQQFEVLNFIVTCCGLGDLIDELE
ncbi:hypothetical protein Pelo_3973 [Pelomyxa schiedti]|nr:hypothetical protein Pelo_3973 [Pelomyxa schiedti]